MYLEIISLLLHFTPTVLASLKIRKRLILKKLLPLLAPFQNFRFRFQPFSSKCFRFHKKLTAFTASSFRFASTHCSEVILLPFKQRDRSKLVGKIKKILLKPHNTAVEAKLAPRNALVN